jgi:DNA end-binding protein Ku
MSSATIPFTEVHSPGKNDVSVPASRASWTGQVTIGKFTLPVKAYAAVVTSNSSSLHQVHARCGQAIRYQKTCPKHGEVASEEIAKAYAYAPDETIVLSAEELTTLDPADKQSICIEQVVAAQQIPCELLSGRMLHLVPANPIAAGLYTLLTQALSTGDRWGVGSGAISERRQPLGIHVVDGKLVLHVFYWPAQRRSCPQFTPALAATSASEAQALDQTLTGLNNPLELSQFTDEYEVRLVELVPRKVKGRGRANGAASLTKRAKLKRVALAALKRARAA